MSSEAGWASILASLHQITVRARVLDYRGEPFDLPALPVETLRWTVDGTARPALFASLRVPLVDPWKPTSSYSPLSPFGNQVEVWLEIRGSGRFEKCRLGFGLIRDVVVSRPERAIDVQLTDLTDVYMHSYTKQAYPKKGDTNRTDRWWFDLMRTSADIQAWIRGLDGEIDEPHRSGLRIIDPHQRISTTGTIRGEEKWPPGTSRMDILDELAATSTTPSWLFVNRNGVMEVKTPALLDPTQVPGGKAHVISGGPGGTLAKVTSTTTRVGAYNELTVRNDPPDENRDNDISTYHIAAGPVNRPYMGLRNRVEEISRNWSAEQLDDHTRRRLILSAGARRDMTAVGMVNPYVEPGDAVVVKLDGVHEQFTARSVEFSFPSDLMTVQAQGWIDEKQTVVPGWSPVPLQDPVEDTDEKVADTPTGGRYPVSHKFKSVENALNNGKGTSASVKNTVAGLRAIPVEFPEIKTVGGYRVSDPYPDHPHGLALDIMMPSGDYAPANPGLGNKIVRWYIRNQKRFAVKYIIWRQRIWKASPGSLDYQSSQAMSSRGSVTANHMDHVHIAFSPAADYAGRPWRVKKGTYWKKPSSYSKGDFITPMAGMVYKMGSTYSPPGHPGVDYGTSGGGNLRVIADGGKVSAVFTGPLAGHSVEIDYKLPGGTLRTRYFHMKSPSRYPVGRVLKRGTVVGVMGNTGNSTGPHLHFETRWNGTPYNPLEVMKALRAPIGGPSHGANLSTARMETLRKRFFGNPEWRGVQPTDFYGLEEAD